MERVSIMLRSTANPERWVRLSLSLGADLPTGKAAFIRSDFSCDVKGISQTAANYDSKKWGIGVLSGARYVFGVLGGPHKEIVIHSLEGCLDEEDISGVSYASAMCLMTLLGGDVSKIETAEWQKIP